MARVLVFDDDSGVRDFLSRAIKEFGHHVRCCDDGRLLRRELEGEPYEIIITDIFMPSCDGLEIIQDIRRQAPQARIIAISGGGRTMDSRECLKLASAFGAHRSLQKPFRIKELRSAIDDLLQEAGDEPRLPAPPGDVS